MIRTLSYLNLIFAVLYFLAYLQNSNSFVITGLLAVVVFGWMTLRSLEKEQFKWTVLQWIAGIMTFFFAVFTGYSALVVLLGAIEYNYYPVSAVVLISCGLLFALSVLLQLYLSLVKSILKKSDQLFDN